MDCSLRSLLFDSLASELGRSTAHEVHESHTDTSSVIDPGLTSLAAVVVGTPDPEILELEARIRAAQLRADVPALDVLLADDLLFTGPDGTIGTKAQDLAAHRSGAVRFREHVPLELRVRRVGSAVALSALRVRLVVEVAGQLVSGEYRYTRVWARGNSSDWRVVGGHVSAMPRTAPETSHGPGTPTATPRRAV